MDDEIKELLARVLIGNGVNITEVRVEEDL